MKHALRHVVHRVRGACGELGMFGGLKPPILMFGAPNSGTTAFGRAIAAHPDVRNRSEERVLWDADFHEKNNETQKTAEDARSTDVRRLRGNFRYFQWAAGGRHILNKHPENSLRVHYLKRIFPEALIVHLVRDGHAVICSNFRTTNNKQVKRMARPFGGFVRPPGWREQLERPLLEQLAFMWNYTVTYAADAGATYGDDYIEVRYEDLATRADEIIGRIWEAGGLESPSAHLDRIPEFQNRNHRWRTEIDDAQLATIERVAHEGLTRFGYL